MIRGRKLKNCGMYQKCFTTYYPPKFMYYVGIFCRDCTPSRLSTSCTQTKISNELTTHPQYRCVLLLSKNYTETTYSKKSLKMVKPKNHRPSESTNFFIPEPIVLKGKIRCQNTAQSRWRASFFFIAQNYNYILPILETCRIFCFFPLYMDLHLFSYPRPS